MFRKQKSEFPPQQTTQPETTEQLKDRLKAKVANLVGAAAATSFVILSISGPSLLEKGIGVGVVGAAAAWKGRKPGTQAVKLETINLAVNSTPEELKKLRKSKLARLGVLGLGAASGSAFESNLPDAVNPTVGEVNVGGALSVFTGAKEGFNSSTTALSAHRALGLQEKVAIAGNYVDQTPTGPTFRSGMIRSASLSPPRPPVAQMAPMPHAA